MGNFGNYCCYCLLFVVVDDADVTIVVAAVMTCCCCFLAETHLGVWLFEDLARLVMKPFSISQPTR
jgi:hypothetical protein